MLSRRSFTAGLAGAATIALSGLAGCAGGGSDAAKGSAAGSAQAGAGSKEYKIGVLQLTNHGALDQANEGFVAALKDKGISEDCLDQQNAQNDQAACQTIAQKFVTDGDDLIFAIGTPAAQAAAGATTDIPIVGSAITDYAASGLVESNEEPGGNVTGSSDLTPVSDQIDLLTKLLPDVKAVGLLYCSAEANSEIQVKMAEEALDKKNLSHDRFSVSSSNEIQQVVESMVGKVDAIYAPTDNTIAAGMATVAMVANGNDLPTIVGCDTMVEDGGLASYSINYYDLGYKAGEMAADILQNGADPATMPIEYLSSDECTLIANQATAAALGIDITQLEGAKLV